MNLQMDEIIYIRHPSYGGKSEFIEGIKGLLIN